MEKINGQIEILLSNDSKVYVSFSPRLTEYECINAAEIIFLIFSIAGQILAHVQLPKSRERAGRATRMIIDYHDKNPELRDVSLLNSLNDYSDPFTYEKFNGRPKAKIVANIAEVENGHVNCDVKVPFFMSDHHLLTGAGAVFELAQILCLSAGWSDYFDIQAGACDLFSRFYQFPIDSSESSMNIVKTQLVIDSAKMAGVDTDSLFTIPE